MSKISGDFSPCKHFTVKKVSLDSAGSVVFDADVNDVVRNTTFTLRYVCGVCLLMCRSSKRLSESGLEKGMLGAKVCGERCALECSVDACSGRGSCSAVVSAGARALVGAKVQSVETGVDVACGASFRGEAYEVCGVWSSAGKKGIMGVWTKPCATTRVGAVWEVRSMWEVPRGAVGVVSSLNECTEIRGKVNESGVVSGAVKATVNKKLSLLASAEVDAAHLEGGNHKLGLGLEFIF